MHRLELKVNSRANCAKIYEFKNQFTASANVR